MVEPIDAPTINPVSSEEGELAQLLDEIMSLTSGFNDSVTEALASLLSATEEFYQETNDYVVADADDPIVEPLSVPAFVASSSNLETPTFTGTEPSVTTPDISIGSPPDMTLDALPINIPAPPDVDLPPFDVEQPEIGTFNPPTRPDYTMPVMPVIPTVTIPDPPSYDLADFNEIPPTMDIRPPDADLDWAEAGYSSQLATQIDGRLREYLPDTTSIGIETAVSTAIESRATARQTVDNTRLITESGNFFSSRGFLLPPASLASIDGETRARAVQSLVDLENDIAILNAGLAQSNKEFAQKSAVGWEKTLIDYHDEAMVRALTAAKAVVEVSIATYQAKIEGFRGQTDVYSAMADAYRARIAAELGKAEFYKAQVEGQKLTLEVQRAMIMAYEAQVESIEIMAKMYAAEMEAAKIAAEIDKIRMQAYTALVESYRALVEANAARYKLYVAQIMGEEAKVKMYQALVEAYDARVDAHAMAAQVEIARSRIATEKLKGEAEAYSVKVDKYGVDVALAVGRAEVAVIRQQANNTSQDAGLRLSENSMDYQGKVKISQANLKATLETTREQIRAAKTRADAQVVRIQATTAASNTRNLARQAAAEISRRSTTHSITEANSDTETYSESWPKSWVTRSSGTLQYGEYHHTEHS